MLGLIEHLIYESANIKQIQIQNMQSAAKNLNNPAIRTQLYKRDQINQKKTKQHLDLINTQNKVNQLQQKYNINGPAVKF